MSESIVQGGEPAAADAPAPPSVEAVRSRPRMRRWPLLAGALGLALLSAAWWATGARSAPATEVAFAPARDPVPLRELRDLEARLAAARPRRVHIVVDTVANRLYLRRGDETVLEAVCSTGTGALLEDPAGDRRWVFDTPRGAHRVIEKRRRPVWTKPDWAFIEEGKPVPSELRERLDPAALGAYGLYFGDGFIIHGTLYKRMLGRSVTHGCIRLGDEDLEAVYRAAPVGTPVYVF